MNKQSESSQILTRVWRTKVGWALVPTWVEKSPRPLVGQKRCELSEMRSKDMNDTIHSRHTMVHSPTRPGARPVLRICSSSAHSSIDTRLRLSFKLMPCSVPPSMRYYTCNAYIETSALFSNVQGINCKKGCVWLLVKKTVNGPPAHAGFRSHSGQKHHSRR